MASLDLSATFDLVNVELLVGQLGTIGLPWDLVRLIRAWLGDCEFYVEVGGCCSPIHTSNTGTMDNFRRGLHSKLGAGAKTSLGVCITELKQKTGLIQLVHFGAGNKKAM
jgi:hypothetical protein